MKKKINKMLVFIAVLAIFLTLSLITLVYYELFDRQVLEDLRAYTMLLKEYESVEELSGAAEYLMQYDMRLTLVDGQGNVLLDNEADSGRMDNHSMRPEIRQAAEQGEGQAVRHSKTLARNTYYCAVRLEDGSVLRVAKDAGSIYSIFLQALPSLVLVLVILVLLCLAIAHVLTGKLVAPIEKLAENLDASGEKTDYEELTPFVRMIQKQHQDIMKNARIRQEFTANVSHELKTPLTAISGYAELIESGMASEEDTSRFARGIHQSANRLLILINDIIRLSELDGGEPETLMERLNLYEMAETCVEMLSLNAEKHNVAISMHGSECYLTGNRQMIEELLYNLCDNAIRYNNPGGRVRVETYAHNGQTVLCVGDNGIGIPREHQERIFERFYRVDKSRSKSTGGTGLGLAIVKHIIARHDARLELESAAGKGTMVKIYFIR